MHICLFINEVIVPHSSEPITCSHYGYIYILYYYTQDIDRTQRQYATFSVYSLSFLPTTTPITPVLLQFNCGYARCKRGVKKKEKRERKNGRNRSKSKRQKRVKMTEIKVKRALNKGSGTERIKKIATKT